ncbi:NADH-quinone oxidoreductase subunit G [Aeromicrobium wangtongii]|uniref:NADH-quinone oxidoreductase n=1 Tax=Aeromicrobium wangtongii TaxID=2969247 RepID=A0ABY5M9E2_9ACTN|nr:NADH-quinone oxidoreductase subunit G [Aeromicrobium wangtongii]MCD9200028.1 NADH-quinone oxidoreductase subunit G [Aeromicrobium wangtongii]UUP13288.1 NADH-quinone oxidoreductase subunit G [Aeromicrobium wangtongii]
MTVTVPSTGSGSEAVELVTLTIDDVEVSVPKGTLVIRAAEVIGTEIPRFCDHPLLDPIGACRQCLVDITDAGNGRGFPKPQASCTIEVADGMVVKTQVTSPVAEKAQRGNLEFLLINHPLDCPVCDKGGECPLQNQAMTHGQGESRFIETKRTFPKPVKVSEQVLLDRERCVLCARCTRFSEQIAGDPFIALIERGAQQQVGIYEEEPFSSYFSGNTIQICPVGALTSADYRFRSRPFDLVSVPSIAEHDSSGSAIRVDHRRGRVVRRLAGDDPEVNEEWITDKDRFAFTYAMQPDRIRTPLIRNQATGELEPASWPAALAVAGRGLAAAAGRVGVLTGGRLTAEDAFAYSKFARTVLGTNDIDFRARAHSAEEAAFLASHVAATQLEVSFTDLERASTVVLVGLEPEDENGSIFLRLRKGARTRGVKVVAIASHATRGLRKMSGELVQTVPGDEPAALSELELPAGSVILVGERLAAVPGGFSAAVAAAERSGARLAWVPRRAGDRGAVETGCLPTLLPGGRPLDDAEARADLAAAWGVPTIPAAPGRDTSQILAAAASGDLEALLIAGVEIDDLPDPAAARAALAAAGFVVSLELRHSDVTAVADVVLPIAPVVEKPGTFISWEGRVRTFDAVLHEPSSLTDIRVLAGIAEEMGTSLGFRTVSAARQAMADLGPWDGARAPAPSVAPTARAAARGQVVLDSWRLLVDDGRGQDGQDQYKATARPAVLRASEATLKAFDIDPGGPATLSTPAGTATFLTQVADLPDGVVWAPANSGVNLRARLAAGFGDAVSLSTGSRGDGAGSRGDGAGSRGDGA